MDGPVAQNLGWVTELTVMMVIKLAAVVILTPAFITPGILVFVIGGWCGQIYIKAQLSVKREMSNAKAPVLGHFGAAIAGLSEYSCQLFLNKITTNDPSIFKSLYPSIRCSARVQTGVVQAH